MLSLFHGSFLLGFLFGVVCRLFDDAVHYGIVVEHYGFELSEGLVDNVLHECVGEKVNLVVARDVHPLARVDVDADAVLNALQLERAKALYLHDAVSQQSVVDGINELLQEQFRISLRNAVLGGKGLCDVFCCTHLKM